MRRWGCMEAGRTWNPGGRQSGHLLADQHMSGLVKGFGEALQSA
ncbi:hypothetical protein HDA35_001909 [Micromonospora purpureochromogenes]|uniref:Uncharacterized protein n=1 Tax=Micromonospora purpureochromogenes TaxID=47872 RepID=A0ABX2RJA3_9ACTN|nr:hypothetical protein [Micromonospora purpureochromogenes]